MFLCLPAIQTLFSALILTPLLQEDLKMKTQCVRALVIFHRHLVTEEPGVNHSRFAFGDIDRGHAYTAVPKSLAPSTRSLKEVGMRGGRGDPAYRSPFYQRVWVIIARTRWATEGCPLNAPPF